MGIIFGFPVLFCVGGTIFNPERCPGNRPGALARALAGTSWTAPTWWSFLVMRWGLTRRNTDGGLRRKKRNVQNSQNCNFPIFEFLDNSDRIFRFLVMFCVCSTKFHPKIFLGGDLGAKTKFRKKTTDRPTFRKHHIGSPQIDVCPGSSLAPARCRSGQEGARRHMAIRITRARTGDPGDGRGGSRQRSGKHVRTHSAWARSEKNRQG